MTVNVDACGAGLPRCGAPVFGQPVALDTPRLSSSPSVTPPAPQTGPGSPRTGPEPASAAAGGRAPDGAQAAAVPQPGRITRAALSQAASDALAAAAADLADGLATAELRTRLGGMAELVNRWLIDRAELLALVADALDHVDRDLVDGLRPDVGPDSCSGCGCAAADHRGGAFGACVACGDCDQLDGGPR